MLLSENISDFLEFINAAKTDHRISCDLVKENEEALADLAHRFELYDDIYNDTAKLAKAYRKVRRERRRAKDKMIITKPITDWAEKNSNCLKSLNQLLGEVRKTERSLLNRHYNYKTDIVSKTIGKN